MNRVSMPKKISPDGFPRADFYFHFQVFIPANVSGFAIDSSGILVSHFSGQLVDESVVFFQDSSKWRILFIRAERRTGPARFF